MCDSITDPYNTDANDAVQKQVAWRFPFSMKWQRIRCLNSQSACFLRLTDFYLQWFQFHDIQVNIYKMYSGYMDDVPSILVSLYLGPLSGKKDSVQDKLKYKLFQFSMSFQILGENQSCWFRSWATSSQEPLWFLFVSSQPGTPGDFSQKENKDSN